MRSSTVKITTFALLVACSDGTTPPDAGLPLEFALSAPCTYYVLLEGTEEHHGPVPYLLPVGLGVTVAEPWFATLGGECDPQPDGTTRCFRGLRAVTADGERLGATGRLRPEDTECVWRNATE